MKRNGFTDCYLKKVTIVRLFDITFGMFFMKYSVYMTNIFVTVNILRTQKKCRMNSLQQDIMYLDLSRQENARFDICITLRIISGTIICMK